MNNVNGNTAGTTAVLLAATFYVGSRTLTKLQARGVLTNNVKGCGITNTVLAAALAKAIANELGVSNV